MTWVIGVPTTFGYSAAIADVQVTFEDKAGNKEYFDCLQKIYPIGRDFCAGFAGSVRIGFALLQSLVDNYSGLERGSAWYPGYVARTWQPIAVKIFNSFPSAEKEKLGSQILIMASHPKETSGLPGAARNYAIKFNAPDFKPHFEKADKLVSIGNGTKFYEDEIDDFNKDFPFELMKMEVGMQYGYGQALMHHLTDTALRNPHPGVSKHFHLVIVTTGKYMFTSNDTEYFYQDGRTEKITMPPVAKSYKEFTDYCGKIKENPAAARA